MAFLQVNFFSQTLGINTSMNVILPEKRQGVGVSEDIKTKPQLNPKKTKLDVWDGETPLPVLYLLHGASDDHTIWERRTSIERYVSGKQIAVVMPAAGLSFYANERYGFKYWDFISKELPSVVQSFFKISTKREDTYVAGLSMGSYGALKLALNCPDQFSKAAMFSGGMYLLEKSNDLDPFIERVFGKLSNIKGTEDDLEEIARRLDSSGEMKPELFFACGDKDFVFDGHMRTVHFLENLGYPVVSVVEEGAYHEWAFWDKMIVRALEWMEIL